MKRQNKLSRLTKRETKIKKKIQKRTQETYGHDGYKKNLNGRREKAERRMEQKQCLKRWCLRISKINKRHLAKGLGEL